VERAFYIIAGGEAEAMRVWGLGIAAESSQDCKNCNTLLNSFFHCQWSSAWHALDILINPARFDMFINPIMDQVSNSIRSKILLEYCRAYETINIEDMAKSFDLSMSSLEDMLLTLIKAGRLSARIDGIQHRVTRYTKEPRTKAFDSTIRAGASYQDWTERDLYYANIVDAGYLNAEAVRKAIQEFRSSFMMGDFDMDDDEEGGVKLGLGDFVFYSVLIGRAAMTDMLTVFTSYTAIVTGLFGTLILLGLFKRALPALPISIALGTIFYFLSRTILLPFIMSNAYDEVLI